MVVQHNLRAMNSNRMLGLTTATQAKSTEKLSSGYKINRAADDAAGLSISEKMRKQIRGLTQASLNAQDGISAVQTAEGALTEVHDMLQRMNELAVKASNGTNSEDDRGYIQDEIDQLVKEIDRVSETTKFNETYLLKGDGTATREVTKTTPAQEAVDVKAEYVSGKGVDNVALKKDKTVAANAVWYEKGKTTAISDADIDRLFEVKNNKVVLKEGVELYKKAAVSNTEYGEQLTGEKISQTEIDDVFEVGSSKVSTKADATGLVDADKLAELFNTDGSIKTKFYAQKTTDGSWVEVGAEQVAKFIKVTPGQDAVAAGTKTETETYTKALTLSLHVGADGNDDNKISLDIESMSAEGIGVKGLDVSTEDAATKSIETLKASIQKVSTQRSALGAIQNRLEHTINNLDNVVENTTSAESQIRDTDMATEMVKYSNNNILAQAGQAMLAQSNQANQGVLSLLQ